jgi:apolipoprotein N-acyltransferase
MQTTMIAHGPWWRAVRALMVAVSLASPLVLAFLLFAPGPWPEIAARLENPLRLVRTFTVTCLAPGLASWLLGRVFAGRLTIDRDTVVLERPGERAEIPCTSIARLVPWTLPLPAAGVSLQLRSGRWFPWRLQIADPVAFGDALADAGAPESVRLGARTPAALYAASTAIARGRTDHPMLKFVAFALLPTLPLFRLHQWIAFGGTFGEYYMYGLGAYLLGFAIFWSSSIVHLVLWAAVLRAVLEPLVAAVAWRAPDRTLAARRAVEATLRVLYYGAVPVFLLRLYLQSA